MTGRPVLAIVSIIIFMGMLGASSDSPVGYASPYTDIDVNTAYDMITNSSYPHLVVLDVRTQSEYDSGHIYSTVWIPYTELESRIGELTGHEDHEIIVYCLSGGRSVIASNILDSYNFTEVYNMLGGFSAWQSADYPVWIGTVHNIDTAFRYDTIQAAIDAPQTLDGHTIFVEEGTYHENLIIYKHYISLIGENKINTFIDGSNNGTVVDVSGDHVNITGFTIQNSGGLDFGIVLSNVDCCNITGNSVANNRRGIRLEHSSSNNISGNSITANNYDGISLYSSSRNTVCGNNITNNGFGIHLYSSSRNTVCGNNVTNNVVGIFLECSANNNIFSGNNITNNDCGIRLHVLLSNNIIFGNNVTSNGVGICFWHSSDNIISGNNITANNDCGILLDSSSRNTVCGNNVTSNGFGICFWYSSSNSVYRNNFVSNAGQVNNCESTNIWDNGYPWGGNYWSNYADVDSDHDGIGDTPHVIDANNIDNYPLMGMFHRFNTSLGHHVNVISNSTIEGFDYFVSNSTIKMYVSNMTTGQAYGFCQVCILNTLIDVSNISVIIDNGAAATLYPNYNVYDNGTHRWIYFAYEHSTHEIDIIPEFSSLLVLSLFMMATLLSVIVYKRKHAE